MPFEATDNITGKTLIFDNEPTDTDLEEAFGSIETEKPKDITAPGAFATKGIARTLGAPVDVVAAGLSLIPGVDIEDPVGGSQFIERGLSAIGGTAPVERVAETLGERVSETVGEVAGSLIPFTKATQLLSEGSGVVSRVSKSIVDSYRDFPKLATATEISSGVGAGVGRHVSADSKNPLTRTTAEITGAILGGLTPSAVANIPSIRIVRKLPELTRKARLPFTEKGAEFRAGEFLKKQVVEPQEAGIAATAETIGDLPKAVATGEKRLVKLYNQYREADPVIDSKAIKKISNSIYKLEQELRGFGYGSPEVLRDVTNKRVASIELNMQKRLTDSMDNAQQKLNKLSVAERSSRESVIVRNELEKVMQIDKDLVADAWNNVPKQFVSKFNRTSKAVSDITKDLSVSEQVDIPAVLKNKELFLNIKGDTTTIGEMQGLRSKLLEVQRTARKNGQWNKARISGEVADSILEDMTAISGNVSSVASSKLTTAIGATRKFKEKYEQGIVGDILGIGKSNIPRVDPTLTLQISVGRQGAKGALDIEKVAVTPEAVSATKRFLAKSFTDFVTSKGTRPFNVDQARKWIANNQDILDTFPELQTQFSDIESLQRLANNTLAVTNARILKLQDPKISDSALFLNSDIGKEIDTIFRKSPNPTLSTRQLVKQANKDQTGEALEGLRGAYIDHVIEKSSIGVFNEAGEQTLSGKTLLSFMNKNRGALREIFNQKELVRMERIGKELAKLESIESVKGKDISLEIDDIPANFLGTVSRITGAQLGRWIAKFTGGGTVQTPGIVSERFRKFATFLTKDRANQLVHDAITSEDGKLLQSLLLPIDKPTVAHVNNLKTLNTRMNLWLLGTGNRVLSDINDEINSEALSQERPEGSQSTLGGQ